MLFLPPPRSKSCMPFGLKGFPGGCLSKWFLWVVYHSQMVGVSYPSLLLWPSLSFCVFCNQPWALNSLSNLTLHIWQQTRYQYIYVKTEDGQPVLRDETGWHSWQATDIFQVSFTFPAGPFPVSLSNWSLLLARSLSWTKLPWVFSPRLFFYKVFTVPSVLFIPKTFKSWHLLVKVATVFQCHNYF